MLYGEANRCRHPLLPIIEKCFWRQWHTTLDGYKIVGVLTDELTYIDELKIKI